MQKERKIEISALNTLFCLLVVFIHVVSYQIDFYSPEKNYSLGTYTAFMLLWRLASFVVQGFIMLSGVKAFLTGKENMPYLKYLKGRFFGVVLPYLLCFAVYYFFYVTVYDYPLDAAIILRHIIFGTLVCHFYFIPLLIQFDLLLPIWKKIVNCVSPLIVIPTALVMSSVFESHFPSMLSLVGVKMPFMYNDRVFTTYIVFWLIGCYIGKYYDDFEKLMKRSFKAVTIIYIGSLLANLYFSYLFYNSLKPVSFMNLIHYIYTVCTVVFLYALFLRIPRDVLLRIPLLTKIDRQSYLIYLMHMLVVFGADNIVNLLGMDESAPTFFLRLGLVYTVTISCCLLYGHIKERMQCLFAVGCVEPSYKEQNNT